MLVAEVIYLLYSVILLPDTCNKMFCEEINCYCVAYNTDRQTDRHRIRRFAVHCIIPAAYGAQKWALFSV